MVGIYYTFHFISNTPPFTQPLHLQFIFSNFIYFTTPTLATKMYCLAICRGLPSPSAIHPSDPEIRYSMHIGPHKKYPYIVALGV